MMEEVKAGKFLVLEGITQGLEGDVFISVHLINCHQTLRCSCRVVALADWFGGSVLAFLRDGGAAGGKSVMVSGSAWGCFELVI
jgi:hypothetical protein